MEIPEGAQMDKSITDVIRIINSTITWRKKYNSQSKEITLYQYQYDALFKFCLSRANGAPVEPITRNGYTMRKVSDCCGL